MEHLSALISGQLPAFRTVFELYHAKLYSYILKKTKSEYLAEEVVQLTFIKLWEGRKQLSENCDLSFQVFRIGKSTLIDQLRKETVKHRHLDRLQEIFDGDTESETDIEHIYQLIDKMPMVMRQVFKLSKLDGYSYREIAEMLSISPKTVENHISRALKYLRKALMVMVLLLSFVAFVNHLSLQRETIKYFFALVGVNTFQKRIVLSYADR